MYGSVYIEERRCSRHRVLPHPRVVQVRRFVEGVLLLLVFGCVVVVLLVHMVCVLWVHVLEVMLVLVSMRLVDGVWVHLLLFASTDCGSADGRWEGRVGQCWCGLSGTFS